MNVKRIADLQEILKSNNIDGALYGVGGNMFYLLDDVGFTFQRTPETAGINPTPQDFFNNKTDAVLYVPTVGEPVLIATHNRIDSFQNTHIQKFPCFYDRMQRELQPHLKGKKIAVGLSCQSHLEQIVREVDNDIETLPGESYVESLRAIKDEKEIQILKDLAEFTDYAMGEIVREIKEGMSQYEIGDVIARIGRENGATELPFDPNALYTKTGDPTAQERGQYKRTWPLKEGTAIAFDFGYVMNGYCSDYGRSFYFGKAPERIKDAYKALQAAQVKLIETIQPGDKINTYLEILRDELGKYGFRDHLFAHSERIPMGHQIGINVHELPWINRYAEAEFQPGMVMCIEPKVWLPGECYLRVEDMVLITENGAESLTKFSRTMFEL
jgi:Xaa-Pro aminopeptidase